MPAPSPKVKVLPPARPAPPPPKDLPEKVPPSLCLSGDECPAVAEIGQPEKIAGAKGEAGYCYRCQSRRAEAATKDLESRRAAGGVRTATR
ncbi:MAG: hypothetical protein ACFB50_15730 [Rubrobacteraceae bacterium]